MDRRHFVGGVAALFSAGCAPPRPAGDTLRIGSTAWHPGIDPYATPQPDVAERAWLYGDGLIGSGASGLHPRMASRVPSMENGDIDPSGRRITYRLRPGLRWHDGRPFVAADVRDAFSRLLEAHPMWRTTFPYDCVEAILPRGPEVFEAVTSRSDPSFVRAFFSPYGDIPVPIVRQNALGTGPYRARVALDGYIFERFDRSSRIGRIVYRAIPDPNSALVALQTGEFDAILSIDRTLVRGCSCRTIARPSGSVFLFANIASGIAPDQRRAIFASINVRRIADVVYRAAPSAALAEGVVVRNPDRHARPPSRAIRFAYPRTPADERVAALVADDLRRAGIAVEERAWPLRAYDEALRAGAFDLALYGGQYAFAADLATQWSCERASPAGQGYSRLCDPALDRALRLGDLAIIAGRFDADAAVLPLAEYEDIAAFSSRVSVPSPRAAFVPWFADITQWSMA